MCVGGVGAGRVGVGGCGVLLRGGAGDEFLAEGCADGVEEVEQDASAGELLEQNEAEGGEDEVGGPDPEERRQLAGFCEGDADVGEEVVAKDEQQGEDKAGTLAAALGGRRKDRRSGS